MLVLENISKSFDGRQILKNVNLVINQGDVFSLIGPNGAGKTTIIRTILGLYRPDYGSIIYNGKLDDCEFKSTTSFVLEGFYLYKQLSARKNVELFYRIYHKKINKETMNKAIDDVIKLVGLESVQFKKISFFSQGMKQRLCLARAMVIKPKFLILDEPLKGLDVDGKFEIRKLIKSLAESGCTIFMNSHDLFEVEKLSTKIAFIKKGEILEQGTVMELKEKYQIEKDDDLELLYMKVFNVNLNESND